MVRLHPKSEKYRHRLHFIYPSLIVLWRPFSVKSSSSGHPVSVRRQNIDDFFPLPLRIETQLQLLYLPHCRSASLRTCSKGKMFGKKEGRKREERGKKEGRKREKRRRNKRVKDFTGVYIWDNVSPDWHRRTDCQLHW